MFILKAHSWSFLSIFETELNLSDACKKSVCCVCYTTVSR